jgi:hypothetical protein
MAEVDELIKKLRSAADVFRDAKWIEDTEDFDWTMLTRAADALERQARPSVSEEAVEALLPVLCTAYSCGYTDRPGDRDWSDNIDRLTTDLRTALTALPNTGDGVGVRELEWDGRNANTPFGTYTISYPAENSGVTLVFEGHAVGEFTFPSENVARSAAQADYEKRIRSALTNGGQS